MKWSAALELRLALGAWLLVVGGVGCAPESDEVERPGPDDAGSAVEAARSSDASSDAALASPGAVAQLDGSAVGVDGGSAIDAARAGPDANSTGSEAGTPREAGAAGDAGSGRDATITTDPNPALPPITIWIAGDSTVANGNTPCPRGWGGVFAEHFLPQVKVQNLAAGGRSVHTWLYNVLTTMENGECALQRDAQGQPTLQARWQTMLDGMRAGDFLLVQFGINDASATCDRHVGASAFETAFGMMAMAAKQRGAQPIFLTPVSAISCSGGTARGNRGAYVTATQSAGMRFGAPVIDLHARSVALYQEHAFCPLSGGDVSASTGGPVGDFFCDDHTHFSMSGAREIAELVVRELSEQNSPLAQYLR